MKKLAVTLLALLVVGLALWLFFYPRKSTDTFVERVAARKQPLNSSSEPASITKQAKADEEADKAIEAADRAERLRDRQERIERANREYNTSITFYGVVLELAGLPVAGATVDYTSTEGSFVGTRHVQSTTDGRFTISGIRGKYLDVHVAHPDFYELRDSRRSFTYAGNDRSPDFKPDPAKPEIFRLKKKGEAAELIHQDDHILFTKEDGHARSFSLYDHTRRRDQPEYVILQGAETAERDKQGKPIRRLEMVVPEGGIQQRTDPFAFTAPADGYQSSMYFMRPEFGGKLDYFVKFNNGNYARFTIMGSAGDYLIDSYFNPDRSPNLEYDRDREITVVQTGKMGVDLVYPAKKEEPKKP